MILKKVRLERKIRSLSLISEFPTAESMEDARQNNTIEFEWSSGYKDSDFNLHYLPSRVQERCTNLEILELEYLFRGTKKGRIGISSLENNHFKAVQQLMPKLWFYHQWNTLDTHELTKYNVPVAIVVKGSCRRNAPRINNVEVLVDNCQAVGLQWEPRLIRQILA